MGCGGFSEMDVCVTRSVSWAVVGGGDVTKRMACVCNLQ